MQRLIDEISALEWEAFQAVHNIGGRACCQDDHPSFLLNRKSLLQAWNRETCESYLNDLQEAKASGRNLLMEKYARMMASTAPEEYARIEAALPLLSEETLRLAEEIACAELAWQRSFMKAYPGLAAKARPLSEDHAGLTSFETYMRGELLTYSLRTLGLLAAHVRDMQARKVNMSVVVMQHLSTLSGYSSLTQAEEAARRQRV